MKKTVTLVTTNRADWNYVLALAKQIRKSNKLKLRLITTGAHFLKEHGYSLNDILLSGLVPDSKLPVMLKSDRPLDISFSLSEYIKVFSREFDKHRPDILILFGDRIEVLAIALAALAVIIPIGHIGGGDITQGAIDDAIRHALTKISHVHFVSNKIAFKNILDMGEESWRVHNTGSLVNDCIRTTKIMKITEIAKKINFIKKNNYLLVTQHPETLSLSDTGRQMDSLLDALDSLDIPVVFTYPNIDASNKIIINKINSFLKKRRQTFIIKNAGTSLYYSLVKYSRAVVGNSSSGIYDTPYFSIPAVNIGHRQQGRLRAKNVIDVGYSPLDIKMGVEKALDPCSRASLSKGIKDFFGDGYAAYKIVSILEELKIDDRLIGKQFVAR